MSQFVSSSPIVPIPQPSGVRGRPPGSRPSPPVLTGSGFAEPDNGDSRDELISARDLAEILKVSKATLYRLKSTRQLPPELRIGKRGVRWLRSEVEMWLRGGGPDQDRWGGIRGPLGFGPGGGK